MEFVVLAFFCGLSAGVIGKLKGSSFWIWFLVGAVLPLLGTLAAVLWVVIAIVAVVAVIWALGVLR